MCSLYITIATSYWVISDPCKDLLNERKTKKYEDNVKN